MIKHTLFLKWWLFFTIMAVAAIYATSMGLVRVVWENDATKLSFLLLGVLTFMSVWCGHKTWKMSKIIDDKEPKRGLVEHIEHLTEVGWFTSDLCLTIGMVGTVIGFITMLSGFTDLDVSKIDTVQALIKELGIGMSTSLYTTLAGLICSLLLKIQYFNLNQAIDRVQKNEAKLSY
jgi:hypothetical protein